MHAERQKLETALDPFKFLNRSVEFVPLPKAFADAIKYGELLTDPVDPGIVHHDIDSLRLTPDGGTCLLEMHLELRDPDGDWSEWQYEAGGSTIARRWVPIYRWTLDDDVARYFQHALRTLDAFEAARSFPGGRTRTTLQKLHSTTVPAFDPDADLAPLVELAEELEAVRSSSSGRTG